MTLLRAAFFEVLGLFALWSIVSDIRTGSTTNRKMTIVASENPGGFYLIQICKSVFVAFAVAVVLHALDLIGDPFAWAERTFAFMLRKS